MPTAFSGTLRIIVATLFQLGLGVTAACAQTSPLPGDCVHNNELLQPEACTIQLPEIQTELSLDMPWVRAAFSPLGEGSTEPGCFLTNPTTFIKGIERAMGWDENRASMEYTRFIGANVLNGRLTFYGDDPLHVPLGIQLLDGDCAKVPQIDKIRESHEALVGLFDPLVRAVNKSTACAPRSSPSLWPNESHSPEVRQALEANPWLTLELTIIAMGAGWYDGMSAHDPGTPHPPICHIE